MSFLVHSFYCYLFRSFKHSLLCVIYERRRPMQKLLNSAYIYVTLTCLPCFVSRKNSSVCEKKVKVCYTLLKVSKSLVPSLWRADLRALRFASSSFDYTVARRFLSPWYIQDTWLLSKSRIYVWERVLFEKRPTREWIDKQKVEKVLKNGAFK